MTEKGQLNQWQCRGKSETTAHLSHTHYLAHCSYKHLSFNNNCCVYFPHCQKTGVITASLTPLSTLYSKYHMQSYCASYVVNSLSLDSMLRCLIHILVSAEPISLVAPGIKKNNIQIQLPFGKVKSVSEYEAQFTALTSWLNSLSMWETSHCGTNLHPKEVSQALWCGIKEACGVAASSAKRVFK